VSEKELMLEMIWCCQVYRIYH